MAKKIDPEVEDLKDEVENLKKKVKNVESDIYSPEAQKSFGEYSGTREEFKREKKLRQIASGKKDTATSQTLRFVAAAVFGSKDLTSIVRERFQTRYTKEEIEQAKKTLEEEFGVKKQKEKSQGLTPKRFKKELNDAVEPIKTSIIGLSASVDKIGKEIASTKTILKSISDNLIGTINKTLTAMASGRGDLDRTPEKMKPMAISDDGGQEYLYYPDAPPGRQLYEKSKTGTAGRIASKKVQKKLQNEINRASREANLKPARFNSGELGAAGIIDQIKILLEEESMFRKRDMENLVKDLKEELKNNPSSVFDLEKDEQKRILSDALETAFEEVRARNPDLFKVEAPSSLIPDIIPGRPGTPGAPSPPMPQKPEEPPKSPDTKKGIPDKIKDIYKRVPNGAKNLLKGAGVTTIAYYLSTGIFDAIDAGMIETGNKAIRDISKGSAQDIATAITVPKYGAYTLQELERMAAEDPALKIKLDKAKEISGIKPITKTNLTLSQPKQAEGQQIVDMNQKRIEIQSADRVEIPSQTVNQINNTQVIPVPSTKKTIEIHNQENTFNRLLAQEFDHPATYASSNMG